MLTLIEELGDIFSTLNGIIKVEKSERILVKLLTYFSKL